MKNPIKNLVLLSGATLFTISNLSAVETDPVGYVTITINGTGGVGTEAYTYMGVPMHRARVGAGSVDTSAANTITDSSQTWTVDQFAGNYVMITSGTNEGISATIASNTATALTTVEDLDSLLSGGESFEIRPYTTLADVFGPANESGLDGGSLPGNADNILVLDTLTGNFDTYYYKDSGLLGGTGWRSSASPSVDESGLPIPFGTGFIVVRKQTDDIALTLSGSVFPSAATTPVEENFNWKTASIPVDLTLAGLFGPANEAGLDGGSLPGNADNVITFESDGSLTVYYYKDSGLLGGTGWRSSASPSVDESNTIIAEPGEMFLINRSGGAAFNLTESSPL